MNKYLFPALLFVITFWIGGCASTSPHSAIKKGDMQTLEKILKEHEKWPHYTKNLEWSFNGSDSLLITAVDENKPDVVRYLLQHGAKVDYANRNGLTALILAVDRGHTGIAKQFIEKGAKLDMQNKGGDTALTLAVWKNHTETAKLLIAKGADLNTQNQYSETALTLAADKDHIEVAKLLIEKGAKLDVQNQYGNTTLIVTMAKGNTELAKLLIEKGAKLDTQNRSGETALTLAVGNAHTEIAKLLIEKGAMLNVQNQHGDTALTLAVYKGRSELAKLLIAKGAKLDIPNKTDATALILATDKDRTEIAKLLIEKGARLDVQAKSGNTPLILAAYKGNIRLVVDLLKHGADPLRGFNGKTPRDFAKSAGHSEIVAILEQATEEIIKPKKKVQTTPPHDTPKKAEIRVSSTGTGFVVSKAGHVLTNYHVVDDCKEVRAQIPAGVTAVAPVVARDPRNDLALLKLSSPPAMTATFRDGQIVRQGDSVVAVGFPLHGLLASGANLTTGTISALAGLGDDTRFLQISAPVQPGNSGGPLLDLSGNVVGIVVSKLDAIRVAKAIGDIPQNVNFAISAAVARGFLDAKSVKYEIAPSNKKLEVADVGELAKKFTVVIECWK